MTEEVIANVEGRSAPLKNIESQMNAARSEIKRQQETAAPLTRAIQERQYWTTIIDDINSRLPKEFIWITSMTVDQSTPDNPTPPAKGQAAAPKESVKLLMRGLYADNPRGTAVVDDFLKKLEESPHYELKRDDLTRTTPDEATWGWEFSFPLVLKDPITMPKLTSK